MDDRDTAPIDYIPELRNSNTPRLAWDRKQPDQVSKKATPLYVHEVIESEQFLRQLQREPDLALSSSLFGDLEEDAIYEWYEHEGNWTNRLIHGDSAQILASLAAKEHLTGKVQMVYFDPPYGISFNSTMQVDASNRTSKQTNTKGLSPEPEMVRVFRDTYRRGIHDYLDSIRANLTLARSLLSDDGSLFLQIGSENVHRMAIILDEVFGAENRVATITFRKTGASSARTISEVADYLLWYAKDKPNVKFRNLHRHHTTEAEIIEAMSFHACIELPDGSARSLTSKERLSPENLPTDSRLFQSMPLMSQHQSTTGRSEPFVWQGRNYQCTSNSHWTVGHEGLNRLSEKNRLFGTSSGGLNWKRYDTEVPGTRLHNVWDEKNSPNDLHYVVETAEKVVERCILMSTDPGDLVLDITCGSGTTPLVAERWGRRWIATDASRIPIALARQRILSSVHEWWILADSKEGLSLESEYNNESPNQPNINSVDPSVGFVYERVPYVSAATLAYDKSPSFTYLVDRPHKKKGVKRIASPFTVESLSPYRTVSIEQYEKLVMSEASHDSIEEALRISGCNLRGGGKLTEFDNFEPIANQAPLTHRCTMRYGEGSNPSSSEFITTALSIAPDDASCSSSWINHAASRAAEDPMIRCLLIIAFNFESDAFRSSFKRGRMNIHCLRANRDLMIENLQITSSDQAFVEIGEPDIQIEEFENGEIAVKVIGYDTFNPQDGNLSEGTAKDIQCWMVDTNYDEKQFYARRFHFPGKDSDRQITRFQRELKKQIDGDEWKALMSLKSTPFPRPPSGRIAVRIITNTGVEMTTVKTI
ncbi:MAG: site-specific DNA-methyltransferase [Gammaproteobacteria bacterium]|nr:site-specific DNA-methyltransferase [Gammaproteobacteria bacterium]